MNKRKLFYPFVCVVLFLSCFSIQAQQKSGKTSVPGQIIVSGDIKDVDGKPIIGATVRVKGTQRGTASDISGQFKIRTSADARLQISYVGYMSQEIAVNSRKKIEITLIENRNDLEDVVVVGYGFMKKSDLTGSVSSINEKQLSERVFVSPEQALQGMVAGVQVADVNAEPGGESSIRIRGTNSINSSSEPLFVVDGFVGGSIDGINPNDIASIEVLKDASATAIYGSRGANGVILITTKQGSESGLQIEFNTKIGITHTSKRMDMMNAQEYARFLNEGADSPIFTDEQIAAMKTTDWQDAVFQTGVFQNHQIALRGGSKSSRFYVSAGYLGQKGNVINSCLDKFSLRANLNNRIGKRISLDMNAAFTSSQGNKATVNTAGVPSDGATVLNSLRMAPFVPVYDEYGNYTIKNDFPGNDPANPAIRVIGNPVAYANRVKNGMKNINGSINAQLSIEIVKGLTWKSTVGQSLWKQENRKYVPKSTHEGSIVGGAGGVGNINRSVFLTEHTLFYKPRAFGKHRIDLLGGFTFQKGKNDNLNFSGQEYFSDASEGADISDASVVTAYNSTNYDNRIMSYLARINYNYDNRYLITFSGRADGSSKFATGHRWGYFPSMAFAWNIGNEAFVKRVGWIDQLKLRLSAGVTGNQEIENFTSIFYYTTDQYGFIDGDKSVSLAPSNIGNRNLEWEKTTSYNVGVDFAIFKNRLVINADVYYKKTTDMLMSKKIPTSSGFRKAMDNIGDLENRGLEIFIVSQNIVPKTVRGFRWETRLVYSMNRNKILRLGNNDEDLYVGQATGNMQGIGTTSILRVGEPIGSFFGCVYDGVWRDQVQIDEAIADGKLVQGTSIRPGDPRFIDQNHDGMINQDDRVIVGRSYPKFTGSIQNTFMYKGFSLDIMFYGSYGNNVFNINRYYMEGWAQYNKPKYMKNRWTPSNPDGIYPRQGSSLMRQTPGAASCYVEDASFLRLKNVTLAYVFNTETLRKLKIIKGLKVFITGDNLYTFTRYTGYDPEVNSFGKSNLSLATDLGAYPKYRTIILGLSATF